MILHNNNIKTLPHSLWQLNGLKKLVISSNLISTFPHPSNIKPNNIQNINQSTISNFDYVFTEEIPFQLEELYAQENNFSNSLCSLFPLLYSLKVLNLNFNPKINQIYDIHLLSNLESLYLSGIGLLSVPVGIGQITNLDTLYLDLNQIVVIPAELGECKKLRVLDVSYNNVKYNVNNQPYDWNWTLNPELEFLSLAGNPDFKIQRIAKDEAPFQRMSKLVWMDVSNIHSMEHLHTDSNSSDQIFIQDFPLNFGFAQTAPLLDSQCKLSIGSGFYKANTDKNDLTTERVKKSCFDRFKKSKKSDILTNDQLNADRQAKSPCSDFYVALFDGTPNAVNFLSQEFDVVLKSFTKDCDRETSRNEDNINRENTQFTKKNGQGAEKAMIENPPIDVSLHPRTIPSAIRRSFLESNRMLCSYLVNNEDNSRSTTSPISTTSSSSGLMICRLGSTIYSANAGDSKAILCRDGRAVLISSWDHSRNPQEILRIRCLGGSIDRNGLVNGITSVAKSFGNPRNLPFISACPTIYDLTVDSLTDDFIIIASSSLWNVISHQMAIEIVYKERFNLPVASRKLRDYALSYGNFSGQISVCIVGLQKDFANGPSSNSVENFLNTSSTQSFSLCNSTLKHPDQIFSMRKSSLKYFDQSFVMDVSLARLDSEISPPVGDVALVFTDIKGSTKLWAYDSKAMKQALRIHNRIMRRYLRTIGGYEVKTEGDAFMVAFSTVKQALKWCLQVQTELVLADWPSEIFSVEEASVLKQDDAFLYRGISVRMGVHVGQPVCELDPVTLRMDYFGLEIAIASRISNLADGGQVFTTTAVYEAVQKLEDEESKFLLNPVFFPLGNKLLKGLSEEMAVYAVYPDSLKARHLYESTDKKIPICIKNTIPSTTDISIENPNGNCQRELKNITSGSVLSDEEFKNVLDTLQILEAIVLKEHNLLNDHDQTLNNQHNMLNTQNNSFNNQHSSFNNQHNTFNNQHSSFNNQHNTFNNQNSHNNSLNAQNANLLNEYNLLTIEEEGSQLIVEEKSKIFGNESALFQNNDQNNILLTNTNDNLIAIMDKFKSLFQYYELTGKSQFKPLFNKYDSVFGFSKNPELFAEFLRQLYESGYFEKK